MGKSKAVKTVFIIVLVLVVLAGAVGATTVLLKRNNAEDNAPIKIVIDNFELGRMNSNAYTVLCLPDTYSRISSSLEKNGYFDIEVEVKGIEEDLTWDMLFYSGATEIGKKNVTFTVDDENSHKVVITIKSLDSEIWRDCRLIARGSESSSAINLSISSFENLFGDSVSLI
ncbi:MAG: hypothetical protein K2L70_04520 [Clostridia bacterium]|nr:hypothetical protein [Clostridia bacterium]